MAFTKGAPRPANAGRKKATPNKRSLLVREILEANSIDLVPQLIARINQLPHNSQIPFLMQLLPYCYPRLTAVEVSGDATLKVEGQIEFVTRWGAVPNGPAIE